MNYLFAPLKHTSNTLVVHIHILSHLVLMTAHYIAEPHPSYTLITRERDVRKHDHHFRCLSRRKRRHQYHYASSATLWCEGLRCLNVVGSHFSPWNLKSVSKTPYIPLYSILSDEIGPFIGSSSIIIQVLCHLKDPFHFQCLSSFISLNLCYHNQWFTKRRFTLH